MANMMTYKDQNFAVGDTLSISYKIRETAKEGSKELKERIQVFKGILLKVKGHTDATRMITVRKVSKDGIGVERIIPLASPFIAEISLDKKGNYQKSKLYFVRDLSDSQIRRKLYSKHKVHGKQMGAPKKNEETTSEQPAEQPETDNG